MGDTCEGGGASRGATREGAPRERTAACMRHGEMTLSRCTTHCSEVVESWRMRQARMVRQVCTGEWC